MPDGDDWCEDVGDEADASPQPDLELALENCGLDMAGITCDHAGTEYCEYHCPFRPEPP